MGVQSPLRPGHAPSLMFLRVVAGWAPWAGVHGGQRAFPAWPASHPSQDDPFLLHSFGTSFCQRNTDLGQKIRAGFRWEEILRVVHLGKKLKETPSHLRVCVGSHTCTHAEGCLVLIFYICELLLLQCTAEVRG